MTDNLPTKWSEELAKYANKVAAQERPATGRLAFRGGVMTYQGQAIPENKLDVVIVSSAFEHALYKNVLDQRPFDPNNPEAPICYALSLTGEEMTPHPQASQKMAAKCSECKFNQWGSAPNGSKGKACKESRRMLVLPRSAVSTKDGVAPPGSVKKAEAATASIPVTSVKNWANYTAQLSAQYGRPPWAMITEMATIPDAKSVFKVKFTPIGLVDDVHLGDLLDRTRSGEVVLMTPYAEGSNAPAPQVQPNRKY